MKNLMDDIQMEQEESTNSIYKRKRTSDEHVSNNGIKIEEPSPRKLETINRLKQTQSSANKKSDYFMLSYLVSLLNYVFDLVFSVSYCILIFFE